MKHLFIKALLIANIAFLGKVNAAASEDSSLSTDSLRRRSPLDSAIGDPLSFPQPLPLPTPAVEGSGLAPCMGWFDGYLPIAHHNGPARQHIRQLLGLKTLPSGAREILRGDHLRELLDPAIWAIQGLVEPLQQQHLEETGVLTRVKRTGLLSEDDLHAFAAYHQACCDAIDQENYQQGWKCFARGLKPLPIGPITAELFSLSRISYGPLRPSFTRVKGVNALALLLSGRARWGVVMTSSAFDGQPFEPSVFVPILQETIATPEATIIGKFFRDRVFSATKDQPLLADLPEKAFHKGVLMPSQLNEHQKREFLEKLRTEGRRIQRENCLRIMARWVEGPVLSVSVGAPYFPEPEKLSDMDREISKLLLAFQYKAAAQLAVGRHLITGEPTDFHVFLVGKNMGNPEEAIREAIRKVTRVVQKQPANIFSSEEIEDDPNFVGLNLPAVNVFFHAETEEDDDFIGRNFPEGLDVKEMSTEEFFSRPPSAGLMAEPSAVLAAAAGEAKTA